MLQLDRMHPEHPRDDNLLHNNNRTFLACILRSLIPPQFSPAQCDSACVGITYSQTQNDCYEWVMHCERAVNGDTADMCGMPSMYATMQCASWCILSGLQLLQSPSDADFIQTP